MIKSLLALAGAALVSVASAQVTITFNDLTPGATLGSQYSTLGVTFSANPFTGANSIPGGLGSWATNTNLTVVDLTAVAPDVGTMGEPGLASGNVIRSFSGWTEENGDPAVLLTFSIPVISLSAVFTGIEAGANGPASRILALSETNAVLATATATGQSWVSQQLVTLSFPAGASHFALVPGSFNDWVGVDNVQYTFVPEPGTTAAIAGALALVVALWLRRRRRA